MDQLNIYKQTAKMVLLTILAIALCRFTNGYFAPVFVLAGVWCAFASIVGWALVFFVLMPFFVILNPGLLPKDSAVMMYSLRFGPLLIGLLLAMMSVSRKGRHRLPLGGIVPFLLVACLSSAGGWAPTVSYLKIVNFAVFLLGVWYGTQNLQHRPKDVFLLRSFFLALAVILVFGSIAVMPFPTISYANSLRYALAEGGAAYAEDVFRNLRLDGAQTLFCGVTNHSQALAPMLSCMFGWVACDMLFIERRFRWLHIGLIICSLPLLYMTRSRVALVSMVFVMGIIFFYTARKIQLPLEIKRRLGSGMTCFLFFIIGVAIIAQLRSGAMTEWIRKTHDVSGDRRSLGEALTQSRKGLMDNSWYEFRRNPLIGSGFQVAEYTRDQMRYSKGLVVSASIEKGVLPMMVLGETGILGEVFFLIFLGMFYLVCNRRGYLVTMTTFSVLLVTNMGEATFFSPGGAGGILWMVCAVGGFTIDTTILYRRNILSQWAQMAEMEQKRIAQMKGLKEK